MAQLQRIPALAMGLMQLQEVDTKVDEARVEIQQMELNPAAAAAVVTLAAAADVVRFQAVRYKTVVVVVALVITMQVRLRYLKLLMVLMQ